MKIFEFVNKPSGIYGLTGTPLVPEDLLLIEDDFNEELSTRIGAGLSIDGDGKIQLGNDGAGVIDISDESVFEFGFNVEHLFVDLVNDEEKINRLNIGADRIIAETFFKKPILGESSSTTFDALSDDTGSIISISKLVNGQGQSLAFLNSDNDIIVLRDEINSKGLEYADNYSANWTDHSLVTKKWALDTFGSGGTYSQGTGIIIDSGEIRLSDSMDLSDIVEYPVGLQISSTIGSTDERYYLFDINGTSSNSKIEMYGYDNGVSSTYYTYITAGSASIQVIDNNGDTEIYVLDSVSQKGLQDVGNYSANKTANSYITPNWLKYQSGYNASVPQYFTHDGTGNFEWIDI